MNQYGRQAQAHWQKHLPGRYRELIDSESFFIQLGEQAAAQIEELTAELAGPDVPGEGYMAKLGRHTAAGQQAREIVVQELVLPDPPTPVTPSP